MTEHAPPAARISRAHEIDRFYPLHWQQVPLLFDPALSLTALATPRSDSLHLYHRRQPPFMRNGVPEGSPLWEISRMADETILATVR